MTVDSDVADNSSEYPRWIGASACGVPRMFQGTLRFPPTEFEEKNVLRGGCFEVPFQLKIDR